MPKQVIKTVLLLAAYVVARLKRIPQQPGVLMYHSFDDIGWKYGVSPKLLEKHLTHIEKYYTVVPLSDIVAYCKQEKELPSNALAITIDDGYLDTYDVFYPLAQKHKMPFTLFLTTDLRPQSSLGNLRRPTWSMLEEMYRSGLMNIGLHGHTHMHFDKVAEVDAWEEEIVASENIMLDMVNVKPDVVAYPSGRYTEKVIQYFRSSGYQAGVSIKSGFVSPGDDPFLMRRIEVGRTVPWFIHFRLRLTPALRVYNTWVQKRKV